jgi:Ser/Thr protein kinase RdoA (MazF antagonist)
MKEIMKWYNESVLQEALYRYGIDKRTVRNLKGNESLVFAYGTQGIECVLKIHHSSRRSIDQIMGELDWLQFLTEKGVRVSRAVPSKNGNYTERIEAKNSYFTAVAYEMARGNILDEESYDPALLQQWGQIMGRMHAAAKLYQPANPAHKRPEWHEIIYINAEKWLPPSETAVRRKLDDLYEQLHRLPKEKENYGLIHSDLHHRNFLVDHGEITVIDFDDLEYHWFINDIAKTLYNEAFTFSIKPQDRNSFAGFFLKHFMNGYWRENRLDADWMVRLQDFIKLRHLFIFIRLFQRLDMNSLGKEEQNRLTEYRYSIEQGMPLLELDLESI